MALRRFLVAGFAAVMAAVPIVMPHLAGASDVATLSPFTLDASGARLPGPPIQPFRAAPVPTPRSVESQNRFYSANWSGFVDGASAGPAGVTADGSQFSTVSGAWRTPWVLPFSGAGSVSSSWVGIGGMFGHTLLQAGTIEYLQGTTPAYVAFIEDYPNPALAVNAPLHPGDHVQTTVNEQGGTWYVDVTDSTQQWTTGPIDVAAAYAADGDPFFAPDPSSAEWILEDPTCGAALCPFAQVTPEAFTATQDNATQPTARSPLQSVIVNPQGIPEVLVAPGSIGTATTAAASYNPFVVVRLPAIPAPPNDGEGPHRP